ncbi:MAG TPA: hypothetical protein VM933_06195, partial [Acidimicrobiales bacterium]|nr:hypothetical protein [Acidimicrobiales bacterium]
MDSPSDEQLARLVVRALAAVITLTLAGGIASAAGRVSDGAGDETAADVIVGGPNGFRPRGGLGPLPGTAVAAYVRAAEAEVRSVEGRRAAVVSFRGYSSPEEAVELVDGTHVVSWLVALPGGRPQELAPDRDLVAWTKAQRDEAVAEKKALEQLLPTVEDPDFERQYQDDIDHLAALLAVGPDRRDVVFGALVVGSGDALRAVAARRGVLLVDLDPDSTPPPPTAYVGLRPEEDSDAGEPATRPTD